MNYTIEDVNNKARTYLKGIGGKYNEDKKVDFQANPKMEKVENLNNNIIKALQNVCTKNNIKYQDTFDIVINYVESAILASKNWFNPYGLNYQEIRDFVNISVKKEKEFLEEFKLKYSVKGTKNEKISDIKELLCVAQAGRTQVNLEGMNKWQYIKTMRMRNISIEDNSDAYMQNIDLKANCWNPILKKFNSSYKQSNMLIGTHTHSYAESENEYSSVLEKFELILVLTE